MHKPAAKLSCGEKQQVALAMGLMKKPRMLLLDEPSLGLVPNLLSDVFKQLHEINRHNPFEMTYEDFKEDVSVYLLPDELTNPESWLRRNFKSILEQELFNWCTDDSLWPPHLDYKTFRSFFKQHFCSMVVDLCNGDIQSESFQE